MPETVYEDLLNAQIEFGAALKDSTNPHYKSQYASLDNCINAVKPALNKYGFYLLQETMDSKTENTVTVTTKFIHKSGTSLTMGILTLPSTKTDAQGLGSALTYARRYGLLAACGIAPEDDDGESATKGTDTWFTDKLLPLIEKLLVAGKFTRDNAPLDFTPKRAVGLIKAYLNKTLTKEEVIANYDYYKAEL